MQSRNYNDRPRRTGGRYRSPYKTYFVLALVLMLVVVAILLFVKFPVYLAYMAGINAVTFSFYVFDKIQAKRDGGRVPELVLHCLAILGGAVGGLTGMWLLHHKNRKPVFHIILWASFIVHLAIFIFFSKSLLAYNFNDLLDAIKR